MREIRERYRQSGDSRGQSTAIGFVLVIAIVLSGTTLILAIGSGALADTQQILAVERAEKSLAQLDSKTAMVALGQSSAQDVSLATTQRGDYKINDTAGSINVTLFPSSGGSEVLVDQSMGELRYESGQTAIAYQGGGVWRKTGNGSTMVSPPEFHYRDLTITLPIVRIDGQGSVSDSMTVSQNETAIRKFPTSGTNNPLEDARVQVKVQSEYYKAWGAFFEERTDGSATIHHSNNTAVLDLVTPAPDQPNPQGAVVSGASGDTVTIDNKGCMDSYDSSSGYSPGNLHKCNNNDDKGVMYLAGGLEVTSDANKVRGNVTAGRTVELNSGNAVMGEVKCAKGNHNCKTGTGSAKDGVNNTNSEVPVPEAIGNTVSDKVQEMKSNNDNGAASAISGSSLDSGTTVTLTQGKYYLDEIDRDSGNNLILDTTSGDIVLAIEDGLDLDGADIIVEGDGRVKVYLGEAGSDSEMNLDNQAKIKTVDSIGPPSSRQYNSTRFWLYSGPGFDGDIDTESQFTGVIYAPEGDTGNAGEVDMAGGVVFGAVVAHVDDMDENNKNAAIHYDEALSDESTQRAASPDDPRITNVHLTVNRVNVTG